MIDIQNYLEDGANWQAQCVLAYLKFNKCNVLDKTYNKERNKFEGDLLVGRLENCREQGYVFTIHYHNVNVNYWVYEHRNSDCICIKKFEGAFLNTPTINDIDMKDKWDFDVEFKCGEIMETGDYIINDMKEQIENYLSSHNI